MRKDQFSLEVIVNGKPVHEYPHKGDTFIEGRNKSVFKLSFKNSSNARVLIVPSVDGLSPFNGEAAGPDSPGMIVPAYGTVELPGWMVDTSKSAEFVFQDRETSYARGIDPTTTNTGVIGVLVFAETMPEIYHVVGCNPMSGPKYVPPYLANPNDGLFGWNPNTSDASRRIQVGSSYNTTSTAKLSLTADSTAEQLGVGWGQSVDFNVNSTTFDKGDNIAQLVIFYDSRKNLERRGIVIERRDSLSIRPNPFPGIGCKPPAGWKP